MLPPAGLTSLLPPTVTHHRRWTRAAKKGQLCLRTWDNCSIYMLDGEMNVKQAVCSSRKQADEPSCRPITLNEHCWDRSRWPFKNTAAIPSIFSFLIIHTHFLGSMYECGISVSCLKLQTVSLFLKTETLQCRAHASPDASPVTFNQFCVLFRPGEVLQPVGQTGIRLFSQTLVFFRALSAELLELQLDLLHNRKCRITVLRPNCQEESVAHGGVCAKPALIPSVPLKLGGRFLLSYG